MDDKEILRRVIQGFQLIPAKRGFGHPYVTKTGAATPDLSKRINAWIKQNFPQSNIMTSYEGVYKTINFRRVMAEHLIFEHFIKQLLEKEYTSLGIGSFRGASHKNRTDKFVDLLKNKTPIPLKKGESSIISKVEITKDGEATFYDPITQSKELKDILPTLKAGDRLYLIDTNNKKHSITTVAKTPELGGKGKGYQRGTEIESSEIASVQKQIDNNNTGEGISIEGVAGNVFGIKKVEGAQKADFKLIDKEGNSLAYIQHKSPKHQQMSGIAKEPYSSFPEVQSFAKETYSLVNNSPEKRLSKPYSKSIEDDKLKTLAVYGNPEQGSKGVQFYIIGNIELKSLGNGKFKLTSTDGSVYTNGEIPEGNEAPTLVATYRAGRNQRVPGSRDVIPDTRIGIYPKSYVSKS